MLKWSDLTLKGKLVLLMIILLCVGGSIGLRAATLTEEGSYLLTEEEMTEVLNVFDEVDILNAYNRELLMKLKDQRDLAVWWERQFNLKEAEVRNYKMIYDESTKENKSLKKWLGVVSVTGCVGMVVAAIVGGLAW